MNLPSVTHIRSLRNEPVAYYEGTITSDTGEGRFIIDGRVEAETAFSCIVRPECGDTIVYLKTDNAAYISAILSRPDDSPATIEIEGVKELSIKSKKLNLTAEEHLDLQSLKTIGITSFLGALTLTGMNIVTTVKESIIQHATSHITSVKNYSLNAKNLLRTHGKHHIMTADEEIRMDGERINMG